MSVVYSIQQYHFQLLNDFVILRSVLVDVYEKSNAGALSCYHSVEYCNHFPIGRISEFKKSHNKNESFEKIYEKNLTEKRRENITNRTRRASVPIISLYDILTVNLLHACNRIPTNRHFENKYRMKNVKTLPFKHFDSTIANMTISLLTCMR